MGLPTVAVINFATQVTDSEAQDAIRAVNRQIEEDFVPIWGAGRRLVLHASPFAPSVDSVLAEDPVRASGVLYLVDTGSLAGALGYHDMNAAEVPVGFVFTEVGEDEDWTVTLSHEALELIVDPTVNIFVPGPDPRAFDDPARWLLHAYEVCDAVERTQYEIDGIRVSNFVTPQYFREGDAPGTRNDFLGVGVPSFGATPGSHLGVIDPSTGQFETIFPTRELPSSTPGGFARRARAFERAKPSRPKDEELHDRLANYQARPVPHGCGLPQLEAITRTARYEARARGLCRRGLFREPPRRRKR